MRLGREALTQFCGILVARRRGSPVYWNCSCWRLPCWRAEARSDSLAITTSPPSATSEINGLAAGMTPYRIDYPGSYFHKSHTALGARLKHALTVRISKDGYLAQQVTLTNGPSQHRDRIGAGRRRHLHRRQIRRLDAVDRATRSGHASRERAPARQANLGARRGRTQG
jgi:hypothetical protein